MITTGKLLRVYDEKVHEGFRLGRHQELDARSLAYTVEQRVEELRKPIKPAEHPPSISIMDQGHLGSCTGNAGTYALTALEGTDLSKVKLGSFSLANYDAKLDESFAVQLYHLATQQDGFPGQYPPDDTGSSGLGVARALKAAGLTKAYLWATTRRGIAVLLQTTGVMVGMPWYEAFFSPDAHGFIDADPHWDQSGVAGGHEIYWANLESWNESDPSKSVVAFPNSWNTSWGDHGWGRIRFSTYEALRNESDAKQLVLAA